MKEELSSVILSNLEASFIVANNLDKSLLILGNKLDGELSNLADEFNMKYNNNINWNKNYSGFWFKKPEWKNMNIGFQFQNKKSTLYTVSIPAKPELGKYSY